MPKVERDESLINRVNAVVAQCGSVSAAATTLGVSRTFLWRFQQSGRSIGRTRTQLIRALTQHESETEFSKNATSISTSHVSRNVPESEIVAMRAFFQNMLNVIDAYIANPAGSPTFADFANTVAKNQFPRTDIAMTSERNGNPS